MIVALQPVALMLIAAIAYEDGKSRQAEALVGMAQIQKEPARAAVRLSLKPFRSGWNAIHAVSSKTSTPGMTNNIVRFHLLNTPAIACEMGISPVLANISKAIIRPIIS